jgi:putative queuosine salvage protein
MRARRGAARRTLLATVALTDEIRERCAWVAGRARHVGIVEAAIAPYAATLPAESPPAPDLPGADDEQRAAFLLQLNAINFGSGWFPTLRKAPGMSGFRTVEAGLQAHGPWTADALAGMTAGEIAAAVGQDPGHELMALFATHLRELGERVRDEERGSFLALARSGGGSAVALAERLASWPTWQDVSPYDGGRVPFFKRAQIAAADLALTGLAPAGDLHRLTLFADNLVPHVLRIDGVLEADPELVARIDAGTLIDHDSPEEVELRACALHAVERLVAAQPQATTATAVDNVLWHRGAAPRYKAHPRHRARTTAY